MAEVKWIKLATNIFDNRKIRQIECLPDGDAIIVMWIKLLCLAGNINDCGMVYLTKEIPYTEQMLSAQFNIPINTINLALKVFQDFGMIDVEDDVFKIANWEKYQNIEGMERIREQTRQRVARHRERKHLLESNECNATVTQCNAIEEDKEIDIEKEKEIDIDIEIEREEEGEKKTCKQVVDLYHSICCSYPSIKTISEARRKAIKARLKQYDLDDFRTLFEKAEASSFLKGGNDRNWSATFDWLIKDANMAKVIEGNYDNRTGNKSNASKTSQQLDEFYNMAANWAEGGE